MDKPLKAIVSERLKELGLTIVDLASQTGIPKARIYKWYDKTRPVNPKPDDVETLREWLNSDAANSVEQVRPDPSREDLGPSYRTQLWYGKVMGDDFYVPFVPLKAQAGYRKSYEDTDFIGQLDTYQMPPGMKFRGAEWRWFEVGGDSMEPTFYEGDIILCSLVPHEDWQNLDEWLIHVVVTDKNIWVKRVAIKNKDTFVLASEDEESHPQFPVPVEEIREIWKVRRQLNAKFPPRKRYKINV